MNFLEFRVSGENINLSEITDKINVLPTISYKKGDKAVYKGNEIIYDEDCWIFSMEAENINNTEEKVDELINLFYDKKKYIRQLSNKCNVTLWITIYPEDYQYNLLLSKEVISKINQLGVSVNISYMYLEEFYKGNYTEKQH